MPVCVVSATPTRLAAIRCADLTYINRRAIIVNFAAGSSGSGAFQILIVVGFIALLYFLMIRPQQRRRREVENMQSSMGVGDEVVTVGGLYGTVLEIADDTVLLEISPGVTARYARAAIGKVNQKAETGDDEAAEDDDEPADGTAPVKPDAD